MVHALRDVLQSGTQPARLFETHISWVIVAGDYAYKIKKALRFDFLDFSTLAARRFFCDEELRLNRRLAPALYLDVLAVTGSVQTPQLDGAGDAIEYVLRMRAFPQEALWSARLAGAGISADETHQLATLLANFHDGAEVADADAAWGSPSLLRAGAGETLDSLARLVPQWLPGADAVDRLAGLAAWHDAAHARLAPAFERRRRAGQVRDCHGDLHCANILTLQGQVTAFDCIEFSQSLRLIDVLNDIAFPVMDLQAQGHAAAAARLLDRYLECSGDYADLGVLRYYLVLRALVRCKVHLLHATELEAATEQADCARRARSYLDCAAVLAFPPRPALMITHGFSGSGKSTVAAAVVAHAGAVRLRSDVERKRPYSDALPPADVLYGPAASASLYARLEALARAMLRAGWPVVVDAAFLRKEERQRFAALGREMGLPFVVLDVCASEACMRARLIRRAQAGADPSDADVAVLAQQLRSQEPLAADEAAQVAAIDGELPAAVLQATLAGTLDAALAAQAPGRD